MSAISTYTYMIAFTARSGSTLLCDYLTANGLGYPTEYFQYPFGVANKWYYDQLGCPPDDFMGFVSRLLVLRANNGFFGAKITWDQKNALLEEANRYNSTFHDMGDLFPGIKWIYLRRRDKVAQAVSLWRAAKTGRWHSTDPLPPNPYPPYDYFAIFRYFFSILVEEYLWDHYFQTRDIVPLFIHYEDLVHSPHNIIPLIVNYIRGKNESSLSLSILELNTGLSKLSNHYS